ncbi:MAG: hypothetical protein BEN18_09925 [Epulopiscium sp. Nuni2H_MBin001]|nr:MAG: hypothetical protein BEN18_09925 [Epulopiscium sp. Nuni2H_MBin001]
MYKLVFNPKTFLYIFTMWCFFNLYLILPKSIYEIMDIKDILPELSLILSTPLLVTLIFYGLFKHWHTVDNPVQVTGRYIYVVLIFFFTHYADKLLMQPFLTYTEANYLVLWAWSLIIGFIFFTLDRKQHMKLSDLKRYHKLDKAKYFILNNKDSKNFYSLVLKDIPFFVYTYVTFVYVPNFCNTIDLIGKQEDNLLNSARLYEFLTGDLELISHFFYLIMDIVLLSFVLYGFVAVSAVFIKDEDIAKDITYQQKIYRLFVILVAIITFGTITFCYLYILEPSYFGGVNLIASLQMSDTIKLLANFFYFSTTLFTTTGFGDITPTHVVAQLVLILQMIYQIITIIGLGLFFEWSTNNCESPVATFLERRLDKYKIVIYLVAETLLFAVMYYTIYHVSPSSFYTSLENNSFVTFLHFSLSIVSTNGFGDIYPLDTLSKTIVCAQMIYNMMLVVIGFNIIVSNPKTN